ncbi:oxygenase MpaB family protein [Hydrogenophaga sp. 5NK40-0174]|uniref:oxygenase MpaB family protein n=1 Tax=Hydrogenophaga sp. 5NK40-0174 TaxID=3127649 RepID=UPI0033427E55
MAEWTTNGALAAWVPGVQGADPVVADALRDYVSQGMALPAWADAAKIERAESLFIDYGPMSCALLFCASLPECYVLPDLAEVLHIAGQLEDHTEHRIRQTAAMIFPVMVKGGLTDSGGSGVAQILRVRLIHATIRHMILRGNPSAVTGKVDRLQHLPGQHADLHTALWRHGWDVGVQGLPCNQIELAYTLLTFSYVFLRGMRKLGLGFSASDEEAFLHTWNVVGYILGIDESLMAHSMQDAEAMFAAIQKSGRLHPSQEDARPGLGRALIAALASSIQLPVIKHFPVPMTRMLIGEKAADTVGVNEHLSWFTQAAFWLTLGFARSVDAVVQLFLPHFALSRMLTRVVGYHLLTRFLLNQTIALSLPERVLHPLRLAAADWHEDTRQPDWVNRLEDRLTTAGYWHLPLGQAPAPVAGGEGRD